MTESKPETAMEILERWEAESGSVLTTPRKRRLMNSRLIEAVKKLHESMTKMIGTRDMASTNEALLQILKGERTTK